MFDAAIEVGIATFEHGEDDVRSKLEAHGVEPWLAQRIELWVPLAFGRRLLEGQMPVSSELLEGGSSRSLLDEPVWLAAVERAQRASRGELERLAPQSAEVQAVNKALAAGAAMRDLSPCALALVLPLLPPRSGHGGLPSPREAFWAMVAGHGQAVDAAGAVGTVRLDARVFPRYGEQRVSVQVDFRVDDPRLATGSLLESFAGWGSHWSDALSQTIRKFERGSLHVLVAGLLDRGGCAEQVTWERLDHPGGAFDVCLGSHLVLYAAEPVPQLGPILDALFGALAKVELSRTIHALRMFVCLCDGALNTIEVLLDNEPWAEGEAIVGRASWPTCSGWLGSRVFLLLLPV